MRAIPVNAALRDIGVMAMVGAQADPSVRALIRRTVARLSPAIVRARLQAVLQVDVSRELANIDVPILYLQATRDRAVPRAAAEFIRQVSPATNVVRIDGPHFLLQVRAEAAATEIVRFAIDVSRSPEE